MAKCFYNILAFVSSTCNFRKARPCIAQREKIMIMITSKQLVITDFSTYLLAHSAVTPEHPRAEAASRALVTLLAKVERKLSRNRNVA